MRAMVLEQSKAPLILKDLPIPTAKETELLIKVSACAICRTDLHIIDGELPHPKLPLILGHQIVGKVERLGKKITQFQVGDRVGVPWLGKSCGKCSYCKTGQENLCDQALYTGYQIDGGLAEYCVADENFVVSIPKTYDDVAAAPLLCGGLVGYRAFRLTGDAKRIGFYGFGSSAHLLTQLALYLKKEIFAFTRPGDLSGQAFAKKMGAVWAGDSDKLPNTLLDAAIIFAPVGALIPQALKSVRKGGIVISAEIHMSDIPSFPYELLWGERKISSVANLTRQDAKEFLEIAPKVPIRAEVTPYPLEKTNEALDGLRAGQFKGTVVIFIETSSNLKL